MQLSAQILFTQVLDTPPVQTSGSSAKQSLFLQNQRGRGRKKERERERKRSEEKGEREREKVGEKKKRGRGKEGENPESRVPWAFLSDSRDSLEERTLNTHRGRCYPEIFITKIFCKPKSLSCNYIQKRDLFPCQQS